MGLFRFKKPIKPTERGLAFVQTEPFLQTLQRVAHHMLTLGKSWEEIDSNLRDITIRELLPRRDRNVDEAVEFYRAHWQLIDKAWLPAVLRMKEEHQRMLADPVGFMNRVAATAAKR
jgi:hypothetical protein